MKNSADKKVFTKGCISLFIVLVNEIAKQINRAQVCVELIHFGCFNFASNGLQYLTIAVNAIEVSIFDLITSFHPWN